MKLDCSYIIAQNSHLSKDYPQMCKLNRTQTSVYQPLFRSRSRDERGTGTGTGSQEENPQNPHPKISGSNWTRSESVY
jgi:hypothetical protein